jgi:hypothetical protein
MSKKRVPASIRNKNPGAMYPGDASKRFGSTTFETLKSKDGTHRCATFPTHEQGAAALFWLLAQPRYANGQRTLEQIITKWCGGFRPGSYTKLLETKTGVKGSSVITVDMLRNPEIAIPIARAMAVQEAGVDYPMSDAAWQVAHDMAFDDLPTAAPAVAEKAAPSVASSRKWSITGWLKGMFGGTAVGGVGFVSADSIQATKSYLDVVKSFAADYGVPLLIGLAVVGYVLSQLLQEFMQQDVAEGRYVPSGEAE